MANRIDIKVVLLGSQSVGKTCLVERYLYGKFNLGVTAVCAVIAIIIFLWEGFLNIYDTLSSLWVFYWAL
jgi:GTPase SAR1 family protein